MRFEYDKDVDAAYIYMKYPIKEGEAKSTIGLNKNFTADFDKNGKLIGIEILDASKILDRKYLQEAQSA